MFRLDCTVDGVLPLVDDVLGCGRHTAAAHVAAPPTHQRQFSGVDNTLPWLIWQGWIWMI
jgi:hypothetical protein